MAFLRGVSESVRRAAEWDAQHRSCPSRLPSRPGLSLVSGLQIKKLASRAMLAREGLDERMVALPRTSFPAQGILRASHFVVTMY